MREVYKSPAHSAIKLALVNAHCQMVTHEAAIDAATLTPFIKEVLIPHCTMAVEQVNLLRDKEVKTLTPEAATELILLLPAIDLVIRYVLPNAVDEFEIPTMRAVVESWNCTLIDSQVGFFDQVNLSLDKLKIFEQIEHRTMLNLLDCIKALYHLKVALELLVLKADLDDNYSLPKKSQVVGLNFLLNRGNASSRRLFSLGKSSPPKEHQVVVYKKDFPSDVDINGAEEMHKFFSASPLLLRRRQMGMLLGEYAPELKDPFDVELSRVCLSVTDFEWVVTDNTFSILATIRPYGPLSHLLTSETACRASLRNVGSPKGNERGTDCYVTVDLVMEGTQ